MSTRPTDTADPDPAPAFCGQCGRPMPGEHPGCLRRAVLEPPRYCPRCGRRMVVQVDPVGWRANCSRHGELRS